MVGPQKLVVPPQGGTSLVCLRSRCQGPGRHPGPTHPNSEGVFPRRRGCVCTPGRASSPPHGVCPPFLLSQLSRSLEGWPLVGELVLRAAGVRGEGRGVWGCPPRSEARPRGLGRATPKASGIHHALHAAMGRVAVCFHAHVTHLEDLGVKVRVGLWAISVSTSSAPGSAPGTG